MTIPSTHNGYQALPAEETPKKLGGRATERKKKTWFQRNYHWLLYLKMTPALLLIGTFGRRPLTIANLISPSSVNTLTGFLTFLAAPILVFAFLDALYLALTVYEEKWKIKQLEDKESKIFKRKHFKFDINKHIRDFRDKIDILPYTESSVDFIKEHIFDDPFRYQLQAQNINEDVFIDHLMRRNSFARSHKQVAEKYEALTKLPGINYRRLWLAAQITLIQALFIRYQGPYQEILKENDPEATRTFVLSNIFYYRLRTQLHAMGIDENQLLDAILAGKTTLDILSTFEKGVIDTPFQYGMEWLKTSIKLMRMHHEQNLTEGFKNILNRAGVDETKFLTSVRRKSETLNPHEHSSQDIAHEFRCLTTEKSFSQEHPWIAKNIKLYENMKKVLVFPLRTIGLMLVVESLFPFALPLVAGLFAYASIGLVVSGLVIALERLPDAYVDQLKDTRDDDLRNLHTAEQVGTIDRLALRADKFIGNSSTSSPIWISGRSAKKFQISHSPNDQEDSPPYKIERVESQTNLNHRIGKNPYDD